MKRSVQIVSDEKLKGVILHNSHSIKLFDLYPTSLFTCFLVPCNILFTLRHIFKCYKMDFYICIIALGQLSTFLQEGGYSRFL